ncbi:MULTISPECIES: cysteine--tRNA ligase [Rhodobacterales]|jgi:cysteinyl-tRNA synthetase|uniref:cysteine--tRNA ligase n=1 Tax=Rhodobacterales TaxID=204455 RepID=UPI00237FC120|nr:cysteine--tRNA ligase [Phaeobacter gallaeciensis]MDE4139253.1 cysteine--tRNA ligase [Phaeobacter gallaeciensis]MDE4147689.1 cysteine--tRNA ligase [Phaeobacter gallaeciensis]MDE4151908.1 cysteine--tRNA ligase [Phaeobacter gallaeciensis]MDE4227308.1 cysteine--tRNA ligase [Phaeobacter gallaeciensis]MDE4256372.1 cysteine--tRNA ligase [Phaeobacter gallaeciensis]
MTTTDTVTQPVIKLHNTKTRKKEVFTPIDPENVRMYVCGPTVYDRAHLGNARPVVVFDVLYRLLRHVYGADHVTYARNFTDVDDKINARAAESGRAIGEITAETTQWFLDDMGALGALEPNHMPRATEYIPQMVAMIEDLIAKGHAYAAEGHVLFAVDSWREGYGKLSGRSVDDMIAGARVEVAPYKKNPMDFVLWKPSSDDLPGWDSPWGRGRPGWHIECSAMSYEILGETFDIHGGGNDLMFPHHENEIAQSCCAHPEGEFARYWLHNEMLQVEGKKMSKSLGNFFTVHDLLDQGIPGEVIRFVFLSTHYRKPMDWTEKKAKEAEATLSDFKSLVFEIEATVVDDGVLEALADDLNTSKAITRLHELKKTGDYGRLKASLAFMGFDLSTIESWWGGAKEREALPGEELIGEIVQTRHRAKMDKDWATADRLRDILTKAGVILYDSKDKPARWEVGPDFDGTKLEDI